MRSSFWLITVLLLAGCQSQTPPSSEPDLVEPVTFSTWPSVTDKPIQVGPNMDADCRGPTPEEAAEAKRHGPHANYSIIIRVAPETLSLFREGKPLPTGAFVVKEKYADLLASGPLYEYALMVKRDAGYYPEGGDWEYVYVTQVPQRKVSRGRLPNCAACHASAKDRDHLFRSYTGVGGSSGSVQDKLKSDDTKEWPLKNVRTMPAEIEVLGGTTFRCGGGTCQLLGIKESEDPAVRKQAEIFTKTWFKSIGNYIMFCNESNPLMTKNGTAVVWVRGYDTCLSCLSEELLRAGLVEIDESQWKGYTFTVPTKEDERHEDWLAVLHKARDGHTRGVELRVNFEWPPK